MIKLQNKLKEVRENGKALLATNFYNYETLRAVLEAAKSRKEPLILQLTKGSIDYMGLENAYSMGRAGLKYFDVEGWIHLDHGSSLELVERCLKTGFDSVMFDGSELPFEQNIKLTKKVVEMAKEYGANVEAELGYVAKLGQNTEKTELTSPQDAKIFVEKTGVDALAVAIGTAHGFYKKEPELDFNRLEAIRKATDAFLVLHGGSGVPDDAIRKAVSLGICKVNIATEIKNMFTMTLKNELLKNDEIDLRKTFPPAIDAVKKLIEYKLSLVN